MENFEIVYLSSLLNEKAGDFIQDELKKYGYPELKMAHGDIFHVLFEAGELSAKEIAGRTRRSKSTPFRNLWIGSLSSAMFAKNRTRLTREE